MSKFMDFYSHVAGNAETTKKLTDFMSKFDGGSDKDAVLEELIVFAKEEGFGFEKGEVKAFLEGMTASGELSDDELEAVAGGKIVHKSECNVVGVTLRTNW